MTALAAAVMPTIRLLVAVDTRSGTPIARCISGTLMIPPPTPSSADTTPAPVAPTTPSGMLRDLVRPATSSGPTRRVSDRIAPARAASRSAT